LTEPRRPCIIGDAHTVLTEDSIMPRIDPITSKSAMAPEHQSAADAVLEVFGHIRGPFSMLLHSPALAQQLLPVVTFVRHGTIIEPNVRFAAILTAAREHECNYVWAAQVEQAHKNGIREELIDHIRAKGDPATLPADERDVVNYVRQLVRTHRVDDATFAAIRNRYSAQWIVELTATVSFFGFVSGICNALEVSPPAGGPPGTFGR
jgi:4-carboxymuconolactone decarboxylase